METQLFNFDVRSMDWNQYIHGYIIGARQYVLKEDLSTVPQAKKGVHRIYLYTKLVQLGSVLCIWRLLLHKSPLARRLWDLLTLLLMRLVRLLLTWS
ncbi:hypothetical protein LAZ67_17001113 [Cordylochernes scorpioides]|uniref:Fatty acyl-CoA reductase C-terminal domain-containing protein n=1 Tax=Cordylochernes scorpioides TaxID=51811 RepID=A0ABY6LHW9_9ARAC|nr:hypothetical protein LAZ67_17001113 [Cordylochernes scorpioides]